MNYELWVKRCMQELADEKNQNVYILQDSNGTRYAMLESDTTSEDRNNALQVIKPEKT